MRKSLSAPRREALNLRIKPEERGLIDRAAMLTGRTRTDFVLEAARRAAEEALLDRTVFAVSPQTYAAFLARLDETPKPNERKQVFQALAEGLPDATREALEKAAAARSDVAAIRIRLPGELRGVARQSGWIPRQSGWVTPRVAGGLA